MVCARSLGYLEMPTCGSAGGTLVEREGRTRQDVVAGDNEVQLRAVEQETSGEPQVSRLPTEIVPCHEKGCGGVEAADNWRRSGAEHLLEKRFCILLVDS
jgi:hypothetical protein